MTASAKDRMIAELKDMLTDQRQFNKTLQTALDNSVLQNKELTIQIKLLNEQIEYMKRKLFGTSSEKTVQQTDGQMSLFEDNSLEELTKIITTETDIEVKSHKRKKKTTFDEKTKNLPIQTVEIDIDEADKICLQCGTKLEVIGREVVRREIKYIPAELKVIEYVSLHYGCPECKQTDEPYFVQAKVNPGLMKHSPASESIVSWIIYQKFANGLPLYRQEKDWLQLKYELSRTTMANWIIYCAEHYLLPVYEYMHRLLIKREFAMADESPVQVLKEEGKEATSKSYMWLFRSGEDDEQDIILYHYAPTRKGDTAKDFLEGFNGYLMVDGYTGYNKVPGIKRCCCYAHIRRYFHDAIPKGSGSDMQNPAVQGVMYCNKLFEYERHFREKGYSHNQICNARNKKSKPVIEAFLLWLEQQKSVRGSKFDTAVKYALNRREDMTTYLV